MAVNHPRFDQLVHSRVDLANLVFAWDLNVIHFPVSFGGHLFACSTNFECCRSPRSVLVMATDCCYSNQNSPDVVSEFSWKSSQAVWDPRLRCANYRRVLYRRVLLIIFEARFLCRSLGRRIFSGHRLDLFQNLFVPFQDCSLFWSVQPQLLSVSACHLVSPSRRNMTEARWILGSLRDNPNRDWSFGKAESVGIARRRLPSLLGRRQYSVQWLQHMRVHCLVYVFHSSCLTSQWQRTRRSRFYCTTTGKNEPFLRKRESSKDHSESCYNSHRERWSRFQTLPEARLSVGSRQYYREV